MLVLTRKIGQQIILPEQGVTIDILHAGGSQVRLGITAPTDIPIYRREVWDRAPGTDNGPSASSDSPPDPLTEDASSSPGAPVPTHGDLDQCLQWILKRTGGRMSRLSVERVDGQIVIRGSARSYYVRQLAQAAVKEFLGVRSLLPSGSVECKFDVGQLYWRSAGCTQALTRLRGLRHQCP